MFRCQGTSGPSGEFVHAPTTPFPANFKYFKSLSRGVARLGSEVFGIRSTSLAGDVHRLEIVSKRWPRATSISVLSPGPVADTASRLKLSSAAGLELVDAHGSVLLRGEPRSCLGVSGSTWLLRFSTYGDEHFFGLGEKWGPLEKSGVRTTFWNTDVWASFDQEAIQRGRCDPLYGSIPYLLVERAGSFVGILVDSPFPVFLQTPTRQAMQRRGPGEGELHLGARDGAVLVYFIVGPSLREVTRKLQRLVGVTPRPPLWALGHHQSRWGYGSAADLEGLDARFEQYRIPCDGLWLDIDYMRGFRVFTIDRQKFEAPARTLAQLSQKGRHVVAIVDPGVKREAGYRVYDEGLLGNHFCATPEGQPFVGIVWPGESVFPDFSRPRTRAWWAAEVARLLAQGFSGFWLDMNEPEAGAADVSQMRFGRGRASHLSFHNQYALGMAQASRRGVLRQVPDQRPFLLTRAFATSISRYAAVWTGDNYSNETHLALSIPTTLNLALSGVPFNAPDVPGFGGDADEDLLVRWYKLGFLFPFLRNHSCTGTRSQEPWAFTARARNIVRHYIRLRYKLLPYLYGLFQQQESRGEAILRPLFYDFQHTHRLPLFEISDQFMVGPALMQAPVLSRNEGRRRVLLPKGTWYEAHTGRWRRGGAHVVAEDAAFSTPLFVREGQLIPMQVGTRATNRNRMDDIELHVFLRRQSRLRAELRYEVDDGKSFAYRGGATSCFRLSGRVKGNSLFLTLHESSTRLGPIRVRLVLYSNFSRVELARPGRTERWTPKEGSWRFSGRPLRVWRVPAFVIGPPA